MVIEVARDDSIGIEIRALMGDVVGIEQAVSDVEAVEQQAVDRAATRLADVQEQERPVSWRDTLVVRAEMGPFHHDRSSWSFARGVLGLGQDLQGLRMQ